MLMTVLKIISVLSATFVSASTNFAPPSHFNLAALSPILEKNGDISNDGIVIQHAILMALHQLNDKSDGIEDNLLASTTLKVSLQSSKPYFEGGVRVAQQQIDAFNGEQVMGCIGLKAELAELMQREMYCPTNSQQAASSSFQPSQAPNGNEDGNGDDDAITHAITYVSNDTVQKF
jgi:hypothetical protein